MKYYFLLFKIFLLLNCFIGVYTEKTKNSDYIVALLRDENDKNYDDVSPEIQNEIDKFINKKMNIIYNIIKKHKKSYILSNGKLDKRLNELNFFSKKKRSENSNTQLFFINKVRNNEEKYKEISSELYKRSNNSTVEYVPIESNLVSHICPISNFYAISAYLSDEAAREVCGMKDVLFCEINKKFSSNEAKTTKHKTTTSATDNKNSTIYYDINDIKKETKWSDVSVQSISFTPNHLSLISQSPFINSEKTMDTNFYYPSSAGKGIDIYFIDSGMDTDHEDFNRYKGTPDERTITCDAVIENNTVRYTSGKEKSTCKLKSVGYPNHGIGVSSSAGGTIYGVAKKANLHMIAAEDTYIDVLKGFDIILQKGKPHKTVISISRGYYGYYVIAEKIKLTDLINKGFIIFVSAGNDENNCCDKNGDKFQSYTGYRKAIIVGATETGINGYGLNVADYSNFGECVDIYAPGSVISPELSGGSTTDTKVTQGTSFSTPLVAGVAASIMSEHSEIEFDNELMRKTLIEMSIKDAINFMNLDAGHDTPNRFINNGKQKIYYPDTVSVQCGKNTNNSCSDGCCTKDGKCITFENRPGDQCFIENGCQSEFGYCTTLETSMEECEKEIKENEECLLEITYSENENEIIMDQCKIFESEKCQKFYQSQLNHRSICSLVKDYKQFKYIENFNVNKFNKFKFDCLKLFNDEMNKCRTYIKDNYIKCIIYDYDIDDYSDNFENDDDNSVSDNFEDDDDNSVSDNFENDDDNSVSDNFENDDDNSVSDNFENDDDNSVSDNFEDVDDNYVSDNFEDDDDNYVSDNFEDDDDNYVSDNFEDDDDNYVSDNFEDDDDYSYGYSSESNLIRKCANIKSNTCQNFYNNIEKEIFNNPSCSLLHNNDFTISNIFESILYFEYDPDLILNDLILNNYRKMDEKCEILNEKDILENCNKEMEEYKQCFIDIPKQLTTDEIVENCYIYNSYECNSLYESFDFYLPNCYYAQQYQNTNLADNLKNIKDTYEDLCIINPNNEIKEKIISNCEKTIPQDINECIFDFNANMTIHELSQKCKKLHTKKCEEKLFEISNTSCQLTNEYYEYNQSNEDSNDLKYYLNFKDNYYSFCEKIIDPDDSGDECHRYDSGDMYSRHDEICSSELFNKCKETFNIHNESCNLSEVTIGDNDLDNKCETFIDCQAFYENPLKTLPECIMLKEYSSFAIKECQKFYGSSSVSIKECQLSKLLNLEIKFDKTNEKYKLFEEKCLLNNRNTSTLTIDKEAISTIDTDTETTSIIDFTKTTIDPTKTTMINDSILTSITSFILTTTTPTSSSSPISTYSTSSTTSTKNKKAKKTVTKKAKKIVIKKAKKIVTKKAKKIVTKKAKKTVTKKAKKNVKKVVPKSKH